MSIYILFAFFAGAILALVFLYKPKQESSFSEFRNRPIITADQKNFLSQYSFYYNQLPLKDRIEFEKRILLFVHNKNWMQGKDMPTITENQKIAIASYAAQITFGLKINIFQKFKTIMLYYDQYTSEYTGKKHKGEVNLHGAIVLSWKYFEEGARNHTDGINLALHEMAHAFFINNFSSQTYERNAIPKKVFDHLYHLSQEAIVKINAGTVKSIRQYATTNFQEFFACTMETFFEKPVELKRELPELYKCMCVMLRQDPSILYTNNKKKW